ncbi:MAG: hypothetical protein ACOC1X_00230 [Promethearchaeota archaeon]
MKLDKEEEVLQRALDLKSKLSLVLLNFHSKMKNTKSYMTEALDLLDEVSEGSEKAKKKLRKKILDNYNDLPRKSLDLINDVINNLKE